MNDSVKALIRLLSDLAIPLVFLVIIVAGIFLFIACKKNKYKEWERFIDSLPSWASTVGVLGTFIGITAGLLDFNTDPKLLDQSIGTLLDGLKTAFFTSLIGMTGSWILGLIVDKLFDKYNLDKPSSETEAIHQMTAALNSFSAVMTRQAQQTEVAFRSFTTSMNQIRTDVQSINTQIQQQSEKQITALDAIATSNANVTTAINTMSNVTVNAVKDISTKASAISDSASEISDHTGEMQDILEGMASQFTIMVEHMQNQNEVMRGYIDDILTGMNNTNLLLTQKFNEFTELLKKSNTEALKEAMESALARLNEQMSELINRLITDNFTRLTECVDQLAAWQRENKEMIAALTRQYKEMEKDFEGTNTSLTGVSDSVKTLTSDGGKLSKIVTALNEVMVDDARFKEMTKNLNNAAENYKLTTEAFKEEVNNLNEWVRKQRNFADAVNALISTLNELTEIRDYSDEFWKETKQGMNDGVSIISNGSKQLNQQISVINQEFYERLGATLSNLDACIRAIVEKRN